MPEYSPPPPTLEHLNPIQRYMQKGQLEKNDWLGLIALVMAYFFLRPYIQKAAKWWFSDDKMVKGEKEQRDYMQRRAKVGANAIRSGKEDKNTTLDEIADDQDVAVSGSKVGANNTVVNRKSKGQSSNKKSLEDQLLDWDDEPAGEHSQEGKGDVAEWLEKWDKKVEG